MFYNIQKRRIKGVFSVPRQYIAIDLKSFYASVECVERGLDPMTTHLVVADASRTEKTICLAVSPALKAHGISGRARLFEVVQRVTEVNALRKAQNRVREFTGEALDSKDLATHPDWKLGYHVAKPRMAHYMECSARIYSVYLRYVAPEDIHPYSIDEVFVDATAYLKLYGVDARGFAKMLMQAVMDETGITATAGVGTNLYLCKIAMDIMAKKIPPDAQGARIACLDEMSYRRGLWDHRPLTDFWRVGPGISRKLERRGIRTMGDIARVSLDPGPFGEESLYKLFGVNAELLIDHAWGYEPCTIDKIKAYRPENRSVSSGQVLQCPYKSDKARLVVREMADQLAMDLVAKGLVTQKLTLTLGYDRESLEQPEIHYTGPVVMDRYGRRIPKSAHGTINLPEKCASQKQISQAFMTLYDSIVDAALLQRRLTLTADLYPKEEARLARTEQLDFFTDPVEKQEQQKDMEREQARLQAMLEIKKKFGKNAIFRGMNLEEGATARERNSQIGGHKA